MMSCEKGIGMMREGVVTRPDAQVACDRVDDQAVADVNAGAAGADRDKVVSQCQGDDLPRVVLRVDQLSKVYGRGSARVEAVRDVSLVVRERELVSIVGPSGAGKTTILKCLAGLLSPTGGRVELDGQLVNGPPEKLGVVFQEYGRSLMPWMTVVSNVMLPLKGKRISKPEMRYRACEVLCSVGLSGTESRFPWQLSGGMQQRVAIARALAYQPEVLLMDEPFASVDAQTRMELEDLVLDVRSRFGVTIVFVTHDIDEAVYLGDRVVVLSRPPTVTEQVVTVDLPSPRDQLHTKSQPRFAELRTEILSLIKCSAATRGGGDRE